MSTLSFRALAAISLALATGAAVQAVENDYYVHFTATNMTPGWVTVGSSNGTALVPPNGACGMLFESVYDASFILPYNQVSSIPGTEVDVDLGICGGFGVSVHNVDMPSGWDGVIKLEDAKAYWVDGNHNKLIYKHSCAPHCAGPSNELYGGHGWHYVPELLLELRASLGGQKQIRSLELLFSMSDTYLQQLSRDLTSAVVARRRFTAGVIETSVRTQEDDAQARLTSAASQLRDCKAYQSRGDLKSAMISCDEALAAVRLSRAGILAAEFWQPVE